LLDQRSLTLFFQGGLLGLFCSRLGFAHEESAPESPTRPGRGSGRPRACMNNHSSTLIGLAVLPETAFRVLAV
jgi:hypothetical protein